MTSINHPIPCKSILSHDSRPFLLNSIIGLLSHLLRLVVTRCRLCRRSRCSNHAPFIAKYLIRSFIQAVARISITAPQRTNLADIAVADVCLVMSHASQVRATRLLT